MAIILHLLTVSEVQLVQFLSQPYSLVDLLYRKGKPRIGTQSSGTQGGIFSRIFAAFRKPSSVQADSQDARSQMNHLDLDMAWQGIQFLLTDTPNEGNPPYCYLLKGGAQIGEIDLGHGPARALRPHEVKEYSKALSTLSQQTLESRFNPDKMMEIEIYPRIWKKDPRSQDPFEYLYENFEKLRIFMKAAADKGQAVIIYLS
ncbi:MAG: YfbM family protein [Candidatus Xenobiia bacterium LiM19]